MEATVTRSEIVDWATAIYEDVDFGRVRQWLDENPGRKAAGYLPVYAPREVIHAAGILPYRVGARGCTATDEADVWMAPITCSFARCCL